VGYRGLIDQDVLDALRVDERAAGWARWIASSLTGRPTDGGSADPHRIIVAETDDSVVGWASFGAGRDTATSHLGELADLYVRPDHWSQRVGHALLTRVEEELLEAGRRENHLWVLAGNDRAIRFYEQHRWSADGQEKFGEAGGARHLHGLRYVRSLGRPPRPNQGDFEGSGSHSGDFAPLRPYEP
jgi:GNAT superfamily N-acetyltransferase